MIEYRDTSPPADLGPLARLFDRVGWQSRTRDPERFAKMVRGSDFHVFAYDGEILVGYARAISDGAFNRYRSTCTKTSAPTACGSIRV